MDRNVKTRETPWSPGSKVVKDSGLLARLPSSHEVANATFQLAPIELQLVFGQNRTELLDLLFDGLADRTRGKFLYRLAVQGLA
jgi:hypothetical protein